MNVPTHTKKSIFHLIYLRLPRLFLNMEQSFCIMLDVISSYEIQVSS